MTDQECSSAADPRPRLLVLTSTYPRWVGDPEPGFVHELSKRLTDSFRVTVLSPHAPGAKRYERMDGVDVARYRYAPEQLETLVNDGGIVTNLRRAKWKLLLVPMFVIAQAWAAWQLVRREQIDVIHAHWLLPQGLIAAVLQFMPGPRVLFMVTAHGADLYALRGRFLQALKRFVVKRTAAITVVSSAMLEQLRVIGADVGRTSVLSMGVDLAERFAPDPTVLRSDHELLFVGRLVEKKGLGHLISAMPVVLRTYPGVRLSIAGFGPEEAALKAQVRELELGHAVRFLGAVPQQDLPSLYRRAAVFVAPFVRAQSGDEEGLGLVLVEAIGCGCPVIVGDVPAVHDLLDPWPRCLVNPRDGDALAEKIVETLQSGSEARRLAAEIRRAILARFDWQYVSIAYAELLVATSGPQP